LSKAPGWQVGERVISHSGWRECAVVATDDGRRPERLVPDESVPEHWYLGALGRSGMTAYVGLFDVAELGEGDIVFVSAAAGAVGSVAVQIAKAAGHTVIASAGTAEKADYACRELGADRAFCYRDGEVATLLAAAAPDGIDVYLDNVGGDHLEAALTALRPGGRVALCGAVSTYDSGASPRGPANLFAATAKNLTLRGFLTGTYEHRRETFAVDMRDWLTRGCITCPETIFDGLEGTVDGFIAMLRGRTVGKALVRL
jgi:NADPH-dependent curcumin reductase CurA